MGVQIIYYDRFWETFFHDVGCDGTDVSEDTDLEVWVHVQPIVLILEQFHCYIYVWTSLFHIYIIEINISQKFLFPFCTADSAIFATVPLADICMIYWQYLCFLNPHSKKYMFTKSLPVTN
jgi:hypothetical protein